MLPLLRTLILLFILTVNSLIASTVYAAPLAVDDAVTTNVNTPKLIDVLSNDSAVDVGANLHTNTVNIKRPFRRGIFAQRNGKVRYTPRTDFVGIETFNYTVRNTLGFISLPATVTVTVNGAPTDIGLDATTVAENRASGTPVGHFTSVDPNPGDTHTYALVTGADDADNASFQIVGNQLRTAAPFDVETKSGYSIRVRSTDFNRLFFEKSFTITVTDVNDAPSFTAASPPAVNEDAGAQSVSGWAAFNPGNTQESSQTALAYSVSNISNGALFSVPPSVDADGTLTYTPAADANGSASFDVSVQDNGGTADSGIDRSALQSFVIDVTPVNDPPRITAGADIVFPKTWRPEASVLTGWATDIAPGPANEAGQNITATLRLLEVTDQKAMEFAAAPALDVASGTLSFTIKHAIVDDPVANDRHWFSAAGLARVEIELKDDGGIANGGADTTIRSFTIFLDPVPSAADVSVRNPWWSSCVPIQFRGWDADTDWRLPEGYNYGIDPYPFPMVAVTSLPLNGFISVSNSEMVPGYTQPDRGSSSYNFAAVGCYIPFSSTFTGFDSFTYVVQDKDGNRSAPAMVNIDIFEP